jgi:hypothetical protein
MAQRSSDNDEYWARAVQSSQSSRDRPLFTIMTTIGVLLVLFGSFASAFIFARSDEKPGVTPQPGHNSVVNLNIPSYFYWVLLGICGLMVLGIFAYFFYKLKLLRDKLRREAELQERELNEIGRLRENLKLANRMELNRIMLNNYHDIATGQATRSFRSSQRAMRAGFAWLIVCFSVGFIFPDRGAPILIGSLAATGGALAAFLGRTYLRVYERSLQQLNQYFNQPLLNSYYLNAERLIDELSPDKKDEFLGTLLVKLLEGTGVLAEENGSGREATPTNGLGRPRKPRSAKLPAQPEEPAASV